MAATKNIPEQKKTQKASAWQGCLLLIGLAVVVIGGLFLVVFVLESLFDPHGYRVEVLTLCRKTPVNLIDSMDKPIGNVAIVTYTDSAWDYIAPDTVGLVEAESVDEIDTVICIEEGNRSVEACLYETGAERKRLQRTWNARVIDWKTQQVRATNLLMGSIPDSCPLYIGGSDGVGDVIGDKPSVNELSDWLSGIEN